MTWKKIDQAGHLYEQNALPQEPGMTEAQAFLQQFSRALARISAELYEVIEELPIDSERQVQAVVLPAMQKTAQAVCVEVPIERKKSRRESVTGRIDYWVYYKDYVFLIELKLAWVAARPSINITSAASQYWAEILGQLKQIPKREAEYFTMPSGKILKMAMLLAPGYQSSKKQIEPFGKATALELHQHLLAALDKNQPPNWSCVWAFARHMQTYQYDEGSYETYPGMSIVTRVMPV